MESCKYHPDTPPNFYCDACQTDFCTRCVDHTQEGEARCFYCGNVLKMRVSVDSVDSLSKRLKKAFLYPLNRNAVAYIIGLNIVTTMISFMDMGGLLQFIALLFCSGLAVNYSFLCMKATSVGHMQPPALSEAVDGSFSILFRLFAMFFLIGMAVMFMVKLLGPVGATLISIMLAMVLPSILMCFAMTDRIFEAISPANFLGLIKKVGMPYWVLVAFLFIMISSVSALTALIGDEEGPLSIIMQSSISSYYLMVEFYLMGYLLYQYQDKLGYTVAHEEEETLLAAESAANVALAHVNLRLKMGDYTRVTDILHQALLKEPKNLILWQRYFDIVCKLGDTASLEKMIDAYFHHLLESEQNSRLLRDMKRTRALLPDYIPKYPHLRYHLATECFASGDALTAAKLLIGMHKLFPDYDMLIPAYALLKQALESIPGKQVQAAKCEVILEQLKQRTAVPKETTNELRLI